MGSHCRAGIESAAIQVGAFPDVYKNLVVTRVGKSGIRVELTDVSCVPL